ncbi:hypothetical protein DPV78_004397 [Talaromyces pinophilus]|nr:hypothetical protein DPV78_004397 [Talaromyces pinophilus]
MSETEREERRNGQRRGPFIYAAGQGWKCKLLFSEEHIVLDFIIRFLVERDVFFVEEESSLMPVRVNPALRSSSL